MLAASGRCRPQGSVGPATSDGPAGRAGAVARLCRHVMGNRCRCCTPGRRMPGGIDTGSTRWDQCSGQSGRRDPRCHQPPIPHQAFQSRPKPSNSLARCVVAPYSAPTRWRFDGRCGGGGSWRRAPRPHRGRCPSRLLPRRALTGRRSCPVRTGSARHGPPTTIRANSLSARRAPVHNGPSSSRMRAMAARSASSVAQASSSRSVSARSQQPPMAKERRRWSTSSGTIDGDVSELVFDASSLCAGVYDVSAT